MFNRTVRGLNYARSIVTRSQQAANRTIATNLTRQNTINFKSLFGLFIIGAGGYIINKNSQVVAEEPAIPVPIIAPEPEKINDEYRYVLTENPLLDLLKGKTKEQFDITLYQYAVCPFCCKVRAFLDYNKIPYTIVEVNPVTKSEIKFSNYKKVPVVIVSGKQLNDSSLIISSLTEVLEKQSTSKRSSGEIKWRQWVDHKLVHTIPPNIYRSIEEATAAFEYISDMNHFSWFQRLTSKYAGSVAMFAVSKRLKKRHNIVDERAAIYECAREWVNEVGNKPFRGGDKPDLSDLAVFGVMSSIEGLPTFHDVVQNTNIGSWYERTKKAVGSCSGNKRQ